MRIFQIDGESQKLLQVLKGHQAPVWQVAWAHPQFESLLASCSYDGKVFLWKENNGSWSKFKEHTAHDASVNGIAWSPNEVGLHLACGASDGKVSVLSYGDAGAWDVSVFQAHLSGVTCVAWGLVGGAESAAASFPKRFVTGGCDNAIKVWTFDAASNAWVQACESLEAHSDWVRDVAWCPNDLLPYVMFASASQDKRVLLWISSDNGRSWAHKPLTAAPFDEPVWKVSWSVAGNVLAVSFGDCKTALFKQNIDETWEKFQQLEDGNEVPLPGAAN